MPRLSDVSKRLSSVFSDIDDNALLVIGDSMTAYNTMYDSNATTNATWTAYCDMGAEVWMQSLLKGKRFHKLHLRARSGIKAYDIVNGTKENWTLSKIVNSSNAGSVLIGLGTNDISGDRTCSQITSDIHEIATRCVDKMMKVYIKSLIPRRYDNTTWTDARIKETMLLNDSLRTVCLENHWTFIDLSQEITDFSSTTKWIAKADHLVDTTHPNNLGAYKIGKVLAEVFSSRKQTLNQNIYHFTDGYAYDSNSNQVILNPMHDTGWTLSALYGGVTTSASTVDSPNGFGKASSIAVSGATTAQTAGTIAYQNISDTPLYVEGLSIEFGTSVIVDSGVDGVAPTNVISPYAYLNTSDAVGGTRGGVAALRSTATSVKSAIDEALDMHILSTPMRFSGEETDRAKQCIIAMKSLPNAEFRVRIYDTWARIGVSRYTYEFPCFWSDSDYPVYVF